MSNFYYICLHIQLHLGHLLYIRLDPIQYYNTDKKQNPYHLQHLSYYRLRASHLYQVGSITHLDLSEGNRPLENPGFQEYIIYFFVPLVSQSWSSIYVHKNITIFVLLRRLFNFKFVRMIHFNTYFSSNSLFVCYLFIGIRPNERKLRCFVL